MTESNWLENIKVGEDILVLSKYMHRAHKKARITKINKKSITVRFYNYTEISDIEAMQLQTFGTTQVIWGELSDRKKIIYSRESFYVFGECDYSDRLFIAGESSHDYGR
jgi:hypothetical protein